MEKKYLNDSGLMRFWGKIKSYTKSVSDDLQGQINDKQQQITANDEDISLLQTSSTQMEETIKSIAATGGASQATAVTYDNDKSGLTAINAQAAIDELNEKNKFQDETISKKADKSEVTKQVDSTSESDLDISDEKGNVLARLVAGHIVTKNFDSRNTKWEFRVEGTKLIIE